MDKLNNWIALYYSISSVNVNSSVSLILTLTFHQLYFLSYSIQCIYVKLKMANEQGSLEHICRTTVCQFTTSSASFTYRPDFALSCS